MLPLNGAVAGSGSFLLMPRTSRYVSTGLQAAHTAASAKIAAASIRISALEVYELRVMSQLGKGEPPGPAASVMKILGTELQQQISEIALEAAAHYGRAYQPQAARPGGPVSLPHSDEALMPPLKGGGQPLNEAERALLRTWIAAGAPLQGWQRYDHREPAVEYRPRPAARAPGSLRYPALAHAHATPSAGCPRREGREQS